MNPTTAVSPAVDEVPPVRAVLVDDHQLLSQTLGLALRLEGVSCTVPSLNDRETLLAEVLDDPPDLVLLDLDLGGDIGDGSTLVAPFVAAGCRVLVVSGSTDDERVARALELGAVGFVGKDAPFRALVETALAAGRGDQVMDAAQRRRLLEQARALQARRAALLAPFARLSEREGEVLRTLAAGHSVGAIAEAWFVSEATVRSHVRGVLVKLGVSSQLEAVAAAHRSGWLH